ncbi:hypothetical protein MMMDOFMJ_3549 [Methylobacterium gnaphalii]|nr:DUF2459 domain-containing protein [Methylobacterium gnaphalii]GJD70598.1 hypothetical protein MMMDOFMJ_3549 [Methylobacterium gnaphalii]
MNRLRWPRRLGLAVAGICAAFLFAVVVTAKSGDPALYPADDADSQIIHLVSHGWHSGIVLPRGALTGEDTGAALRNVATRFRDYEKIEFGWGEARFYRSTPAVSDVDWVLAAKALFTPGGSPAVVHVVGLPDDLRSTFPNAEIASIRVSSAGLARLIAQLDASFRLRDGQPVEDGPGLYGPSLFYAGTGRFSVVNVCNHWTAGLLNTAGLPIAPVLDSYPRGLILDLAWRSGATVLPLP